MLSDRDYLQTIGDESLGQKAVQSDDENMYFSQILNNTKWFSIDKYGIRVFDCCLGRLFVANIEFYED